MKKNIFLSIVTASLLVMSGCGSSDGDDSSSSSTSSGVAADGALKGASVCVDLNKNGICDTTEPTTTTDDNGNFSISFDGEIDNTIPLIVRGGIDKVRNIPFNHTLKAPLDTNMNVTPLTTLVYYYMKQKGVSLSDAQSKIASLLNIDYSDVTKDPTNNKKLQKISLQIEMSIELLSKLTNKNNHEIFRDLIANMNSGDNLEDAFGHLNISDNQKQAVNYLMNQIGNYVDNNKITSLEKIKIDLSDYILKVGDVNVNSDMISNYFKIKNFTISDEDFTQKTKDYFNNLKLSAKEAGVDDVRNLFSVVRDTTYEFIDVNATHQEDNTSTFVGKVISSYNDNIVPAVEDLEKNVSNSLTQINDMVNSFNTEFDSEFNSSLSSLDNRIGQILKKINQHNSSDDYNFTTDYGDEFNHTYTKDDNNVTELFCLNNEYNLTVNYVVDDDGKVLGNDINATTNGVISISEDGNYSIDITEISWDKDDKISFKANGVIYGDSDDTEINASEITIESNVDTSYINNDNLGVEGFLKDINVVLDAKVKMPNHKFNGLVELSDTKFLEGNLSNDDVTIDGKITINLSNDDLKALSKDDRLKLDFSNEVVFIDDDLVNKMVVHFVDDEDTDDGWKWTDEYNLTSVNGNTANCTIVTEYNDTSKTTIRDVDCDTDIQTFPRDYKIAMDINDTKYYIDSIHWHEEDGDDDDTWIYYQEFELVNNKDWAELYIDSDDNTTTLYLNGKEYDDLDISDIDAKKALDILDVPADIKLSATILTPDTTLKTDLIANSNGDSKTFDLKAQNFNLENNGNKISIDYLEVDRNHYEYDPSYFISAVIPWEDDETKTTRVYLKGLNATLTDKNDDDVKVSNLSVDISDIDTSNPVVELNGTISYLDMSLNGYTKVDPKNNKLNLFLNIERDGYAPFVLGVDLFSDLDTKDSHTYTLIKRDDYLLASEINTTKDDVKIQTIDNNGVIINISNSYGDDKPDADVEIINRNGDKLADFNGTNGVIDYSDGSTETLF